MLLNIPYIQQHLAAFTAAELSNLLDTHVTIGSVDMGLLNRIIIGDLHVCDRQNREMLRVKRLSAKFNILPLLRGKISISSVQLFGFSGNLLKETPDADANFQFIIDTFASKDDKKSDSKIDLRINSILIRRGRVAYNVLSEEETPGRLNTNHLNLQNIIASISLKALQTDSVNASIKRMSVDESNSSFSLKKLTLKLTANERHAQIDNFGIELPASSLSMESITMDYDSMGAFNHFEDEVRFSLKSAPSHITPADLSPFVPALRSMNESLDLSLNVEGTVNQLTLNSLTVSCGEDIGIIAGGTVTNLSDRKEAYVYGKLSKMYLSQHGIDMLSRGLTGNDETPGPLSHLGYFNFTGEVSGYLNGIVAYGNLTTGVGDMKTNIKLSASDELFAYSGSLETEGFDLGTMLANEKLGNIAFNMNVDGKQRSGRRPEVELDGTITNFEYNSYNYENIQIDGLYKDGGFNGEIMLDDPNGAVALNGSFNTAERIPTFNFTATVDSLSPHLLKLTDKYEGATISVKVNADFTGSSIDDMIGTIDIDDLNFSSPDKNYSMSNFHIEASQEEEGNSLILRSPFMKADFTGRFRYSTISATVGNILNQYIPSFVAAHKSKNKVNSDNELNFDIYVYDTDILSDMLDVPLHIYMPSTIKGYVNERSGRLGIDGYFPRLRYGEKVMESAMISAYNDNRELTCKARFTEIKRDDAVSASLEAIAADDKVNATINWGNSAMTTYSGRLNAIASFFKQQEGDKTTMRTVVDINPSDVILNDTLWQLHKSQVVIDGDNVSVDNFLFNNNDRYLLVNGRVSKNPADTITVDLKDVNLGYIFDIADVTDDVKFDGEVTGRIYASDVYNTPMLNTHLDIRNFCLNDALLGDLDIYGAWVNEQKSIFLDALIHGRTGGESKVVGHIFPIKPTSGLDLNIHGDKLNLAFINRYIEGIVENLHGEVTGDVHFYGKFKELTLNGSVMADAGFGIGVLETSFNVNDSIRLHPEGIDFDNIALTGARHRGKGRVNGYVRYNHFKNIRYQMDISMNNMLIMNTHESVDFPFYGTVFATGNATLQGNAQSGLNVTAAVSTNKGTTFVYNTGSAMQATDTQFITFVDKTPVNAKDSIRISTFYDDMTAMKKAEDEEGSTADIRLSLLIDATPDAAMKIVMDPVAGDYISGKGNGNIKAEFYNKGDFKMFGNYNIQQGVYKFSLQEVIRKEFNINNGSTIAFNGDPVDANLDIQASYTVPSASLNDLIPDASTIVQQPNVKVNCIMNLTGVLQHPTIKMNIELPNERDEVQALVRNYISTDEQMNMQMLYLLGIGKFYTENNGSERQSDMMSSVLSSTLSGQLNSLLSQVIDNNNWNIGTNFSTGEKGWTDMEVEGILSGQLLNNRLLINGNFGYRDNPMANTNFVGDFDAEWLLNRSGDIRLKAYNETNDRYYTKTNLTTQGVGIMFKKEFNKWSELFFWNKIRMNKLNREAEKRYREAQEK